MITKLVDGDTVLVKHPVVTDNKWKKGKVIWHCADKYSVRYNIVDSDSYYEIRFSDEGRLIFDINNPYWCDINIIKVDSNFNMICRNCKHCDKRGNDDPCCRCLGRTDHSRWEPCDSLKNKNALRGLDIKTFSIDEGLLSDKMVDYSFISTLERQMHEQALASPLKIEKLDIESFYPRPTHSDSIDALRYCVDDARYFAEFMADFNKKENKDMKKQQKRRNRNILVVKDFNTAIEFDEIKFNGPATIIKWKHTFTQAINNEKADKTVTVAKEPDKFDKTTGFLLAVLKEVLDNKSYGNILEKIDEIKEFDELSKQTVEADLNNKTRLHHCSIKDLKEATEALGNVYVSGSVVKYKNGKKYYKVICYRFDEDLKEMVYILQAYKGTCSTDNGLEHIYKRNVPHSKLIRVRRK